MRIGLISDTHIPEACEHLPPRVFEIFRGVDLVMHAGDVRNSSDRSERPFLGRNHYSRLIGHLLSANNSSAQQLLGEAFLSVETETGSRRAVTMDKIVNLCKRRGLVFPASDIYGGLG